MMKERSENLGGGEKGKMKREEEHRR